MICKERSIDVVSIGGGGGVGGGSGMNGVGQQSNNSTAKHGHCNTLQNRRKSQLITFSSSTCDIKNSLSHEIILVNNSQYSSSSNNNNHKTTEMGSFGSGAGGGLNGRASLNGSSNNTNVRLSYAEEDILNVVVNGINGSVSGSGGSGTGSASGSGSAGSGHDADLEDDVFRRHSLEVEDDEVDFDDDDVYGTHIEISNNANDDSGGGSYEDSHALQSSMGGSNRNSLEKDDDEIDVDVISTDVSCYDQLLGSSCNTRNDDDIATIVGDGEHYTKLCKNVSITGLNGSGNCGVVNGGGGGISGGGVNGGIGGGSGGGENCGIIYANPFMDDEGIAESGM